VQSHPDALREECIGHCPSGHSGGAVVCASKLNAGQVTSKIAIDSRRIRYLPSRCFAVAKIDAALGLK
jgi:hypothetical protein